VADEDHWEDGADIRGYTVATTTLSPLPGYLRAHGVDAGKLLRDAGILDPPETWHELKRIPLDTHARLLELAAEATGDEAFGLHYGDSVTPGFSGCVGYAVTSAPTLRDALLTMLRYGRIVTSVYQSELTEDARGVYLRLSWPKSLPPHAQLSDYTMVAVRSLIRTAAGPGWLPVRTKLDRPEPRDPAEHHRLLGPVILFAQSFNELALEKGSLSLPVAQADDTLHSTLTRYADLLMERFEKEDDPIAMLRKAVIVGLRNGKTTLKDIAWNLEFSPTEAQRLLREQGTTFTDFFDETRREAAQHYLVSTDVPLTEVAFLLGYSELSAFSRAANRWFGMSPRAYRRQSGAD
jgi:AraC-like DNA-binding protein